ncbi:MAG: acyl-CoA/acyl-ACP dehydrogenase [Pirellulales bacterium]|nr:acyl-CoA/acyl-ACP dehydrogenase [Pirellulales bacterium]
MSNSSQITTPDDPALAQLCHELSAHATALDVSEAWPEHQLKLCGEYGVYRWFSGQRWGGCDWSEGDVIRGYLRLSAACLTTTFILTQRAGACRRIEASDNEALKAELLPPLVEGSAFSTVGISHLTTSRRHLGRPALVAEETAGDYVLDGYSPWVTGGAHADWVVTGATLEDGRQILVALPTALEGVEAAEPARLIGLTASHTGEVRCRRVRVERRWLLAGPAENVMSQGSGANTGGLQTSTLAIGLARAAVDFLRYEAERRADLNPPSLSLAREVELATGDLLELARGNAVCSHDEFRARANSLALRASQASLAAAKGSGYVVGHPAGRMCREALFFLVWSCPQPVMSAALCELAGLSD